MSRDQAEQQQRLNLERHLGEVLIRAGLADLVPLKRRGRFPTWFGVALLLLAVVGWLGLPLRGAVSGLALAVAIEALDWHRQRRESLYRALLRTPLWGRIRPSFYWPLVLSVGLVALLYAEASLLEGLVRAAFQWLCFRTIEDMAKHPQRYGSGDQFLSWLGSLWRQAAHALRGWAKFAIMGILISVVLNLSAGDMWQSVGQTSWSRLLVFGGGLYVIAIITFVALLRSMVRSSVPDAVERWGGIRVNDLEGELGSAWTTPGATDTDSGFSVLLETRMSWKNKDNLVSRVGLSLEAELARRYRWTALVASSLTLVLVGLFITMSVFLLVPRDVMIRWASAGAAEDLELVLALDDLQELLDRQFWTRLLEQDWSDLANEPLPKVAFLEAVILVSLFMFETASSRLRAELDCADLERWLILGTTYLALLESEFQYLYSGFITRQVRGARVLRVVSMRNEVLLVPFAKRKASVYRGICDFLDVYDLPEWRTPFAIAVFENYFFAQQWALKFLRFSSTAMGRPHDLDREASPEPDAAPERCWIWSGNRLVALSSFEEARRYARFVALYNHSNGREIGHGRK